MLPIPGQFYHDRNSGRLARAMTCNIRPRCVRIVSVEKGEVLAVNIDSGWPLRIPLVRFAAEFEQVRSG